MGAICKSNWKFQFFCDSLTVSSWVGNRVHIPSLFLLCKQPFIKVLQLFKGGKKGKNTNFFMTDPHLQNWKEACMILFLLKVHYIQSLKRRVVLLLKLHFKCFYGISTIIILYPMQQFKPTIKENMLFAYYAANSNS